VYRVAASVGLFGAMDYAKEASELALTHGAPEAAMAALRTRDTLLNILEEANVEKEICEDVADTCEMYDLDALTIASGILDREKIAEMCYLTIAEAEVCSGPVPPACAYHDGHRTLLCAHLRSARGPQPASGSGVIVAGPNRIPRFCYLFRLSYAHRTCGGVRTRTGNLPGTTALQHLFPCPLPTRIATIKATAAAPISCS
jgi:hypothetical protein